MENVITIAKALSDSNRLRALMVLQNGELCVCHLIELFGLAPSTVSKHMSVLKQAGLVTSRKDSRWVYYSLNSKNNDQFVKGILSLIFKNMDSDPLTCADKKRIKKIICQ